MGFVNPIWLAGLTALAVPIAIHLLSRKENKKIRMGSLRYLLDATTSKSMNLRLNEWALLTIRGTLITLVVLLLSGFYLSSGDVPSAKWVIIEPGLEQNNKVMKLTDSLTGRGFEAHRLAYNFPELDDVIKDTVPNYWALLNSLQRLELEQVVLVTSNKSVGFQGKRLYKANHVSVFVVELAVSNFDLWTVLSGDSVVTRTGYSDAEKTSFVNKSTLAASFRKSLTIADSVHVGIRYEDSYLYDRNLIEAALAAIGNPALVYDVVTFKGSIENKNLDWLIDLREGEPAISGINNIRLKLLHDTSLPLFLPSDTCQTGYACWLLTNRLTIDRALEENLPLILSKILSGNQRSLWSDSAFMKDKRVMPEQMAWSPNRSHPEGRQNAEFAGSVPEVLLAGLILIALALERFVALKRNQ